MPWYFTVLLIIGLDLLLTVVMLVYTSILKEGGNEFDRRLREQYGLTLIEIALDDSPLGASESDADQPHSVPSADVAAGGQTPAPCVGTSAADLVS